MVNPIWHTNPVRAKQLAEKRRRRERLWVKINGFIGRIGAIGVLSLLALSVFPAILFIGGPILAAWVFIKLISEEDAGIVEGDPDENDERVIQFDVQ
jgi:hypothetical protein